MAEFKPMVRMATSEPSAILKLKKGGKVAKDGNAEAGYKKMAGGGAMEVLATTPAFVGRPAVNAPVRAPGKPSMAKRRKAMEAKKMAPKKPAMAAKKPPMPMPEPKGMPMMPPMMPPMKKGGSAKGEMESKGEQRKEEKMDKAQDKAMVKKAFKQHDAQEHKGGKGTKLSLKKGGMMGGGQCYAEGGEVSHKPLHTPPTAQPRTANVSVGRYANTLHRTSTTNTNKAPTGGISKQNAGGYATGGSVGSVKVVAPPMAKANGGSVKTVVMSTAKKKPDNGFANGGSVLTGKTVKMVTTKKKADNGFAKGGTVENSDVLHRQTVKMVTSKQRGYTAYATGGVVDENDGGYKNGGSTKKAYAAGGTVENPIPMPQGNKPVPAPKRQVNFSGVYKKGGEVAKKAMGGRMGQKPAQTIRTAPIGTSQSMRDLFASKGKKPSYAKGGDVQKKALGGKMLAGTMGSDTPPPRNKAVPMPLNMSNAPKAIKPSFGQISQPATPKPASTPLKRFAAIRGKKDGGKVENQPLVKINDKENAPAVKASKADVNLKYPETMNSPQKTPKLKC